MSIPDPASKPSKKLFYAVNNNGSANGIIFQFHPQKKNNACAVIAKMVNSMQINMSIPTTTVTMAPDADTQQLFDYTEMMTYPSTDECALKTDCMAVKLLG